VDRLEQFRPFYAFSIFDRFATYGSFMGQLPHWIRPIQDLAFRTRCCASFAGFIHGEQTGVALPFPALLSVLALRDGILGGPAVLLEALSASQSAGTTT
jgi:hypothetical protein